jgi:hypothetical protein
LRFSRVSLGVLFLATISIAVLSVLPIVWAQQNDAASAISAAQSKLVQCYDAARAAEAASANISSLTSRLNSAGLLLSRAELAYSNVDFGSAQSLAVQSQNELASFVSDANSLQTSATQSRSFDFLLNIVGSVVGTVAVLVGSVVVWVLLKRKYGNSGVQKVESDAV